MDVRILRRTIIVLLSLLATVLVIVALAPSFLKPSLNRMVPAWLGTESDPASFHLSKLGWAGFTVDYLSLTLDDGSLVQLNNLVVQYHLSELYQGRLESVEIDKVEVILTDTAVQEVAKEASEDAKQTAQFYFNQPVEIPGFAQWLQVPLELFQIHQLELHHPSASAFLQAKIFEGLWRLNGDIKLTDLDEPWLLELQLQDTGRWFLSLSVADQSLLQQYGNVTQSDGKSHIKMFQKIHMGWLLSQVEGLPPLEALNLNAQLTIPNKGIFPADVTGKLSISLKTESGTWFEENDWQGNRWRFTAERAATEDVWGLGLESSPVQFQLPAEWLDTADGAKLQLSAQQTLNGTCQASLESCQLQLSLVQQLLDLSQQPLALIQATPELTWDLKGGAQLQVPLQIQANEALGTLLEVPLQQLNSKGDFELQITPEGKWSLASTHGLTSDLQLAILDDWAIGQLQIEALESLSLTGDMQAQDLRQKIRTEPLVIKLDAFKAKNAVDDVELDIQASRFSCRPFLSANGLTAICQTAVSLNKSHYAQWPIPDTQLTGLFTYREQPSGSSISSQLRLSAAGEQLKIRLNAQHDFSQQKGEMQWHLEDVPLSWSRLNLLEMLALTEVDMLNGSLSGQGWVDWRQGEDEQWQVKPDVSLRIDDLTGTYSDIFSFEKWNALISLRRPFNDDYHLDAQVSGLSLNPGVELKNILARSRTKIAQDFSYAVADIYEIRTDLLGGTVRTPLVNYDTRRDNNIFTVEVDHVQLSQITALEPSSEVKATGTLDGILPIIITPAGPTVPAGNLFAREPGGTVRYQNATSDALSQSNQNMGFAMQLLQNFKYDHLQTTMQYQPDGKFNLGLQFQGRNPDFFNGKPTHLNVNLDYNLLDLLESLRLTDDLINKVEQKYK